MEAHDSRRSTSGNEPGAPASLRSHRLIFAELEALRAIAGSRTLAEAAPRIVAALGEGLGAETAELWVVHVDGTRARREGRWSKASGDRAESPVDQMAAGPWAWTVPTWRPATATSRAALGQPIYLERQYLGWMLFVGPELEEPAGDWRRVLDDAARLAGRLVERARAEEELQRSAEQLRTVVNTAPMMLFALDASGVITTSEGMGLLALGIEPGELVGRSALEVYAHNPTGIEQIRRALAGESFTSGVEEAGRTLETRWTATRHADGSPAGTVGVGLDVTHRRQAEAALFHSEERLRYMGMATRDAVYDWDIVRGRVWRNEAYLALLSPGAAPGDGAGWRTARMHADDEPRITESIHAAFRSRSSSWSGEYRLRRGDGSYALVIDRGYVLYDRQGRPIRMIGAVTDASQRTLADVLREGQSRVLEVIALDAPLDEVLNTLCRVIEAQAEGLSCSVLLLDDDGVHVRHGAAPSLPASYIRALDGAPIGPRRGSCGTAMYHNRPVIVTDVLLDPLWDDHRELALEVGFRACWSIPIVAHNGKVMGSFAMYYREPRSPSQAELELIELAARLGSIALERHQSSVQLRASLQEKEILLKEIHHRVKNNLQIINSLLALQAEKLTEPRVLEVFTESQNRVRAMALVHEALYRSGDLSRVRFAAHVESLCAHLFRSYSASTRVRCELDIADVALDLDRAIPCGLIINELVSNALKHAFPGERDGCIVIRLESQPGPSCVLTVSDNGVGLPEKVDPQRGDTLGLQLVADLTEQVAGTLTIARDNGTSISIRFAGPRKEAA